MQHFSLKIAYVSQISNKPFAYGNKPMMLRFTQRMLIDNDIKTESTMKELKKISQIWMTQKCQFLEKNMAKACGFLNSQPKKTFSHQINEKHSNKSSLVFRKSKKKNIIR